MGTTAAIVGGSIVGGLISKSGADKAADAQSDAAKASSATQMAMFNKNVELMQPMIDARDLALKKLLGESYTQDEESLKVPTLDSVRSQLVGQEVTKLGGDVPRFGLGLISGIINSIRTKKAAGEVTDEDVQEAYAEQLANYNQAREASTQEFPGLLTQGPGEFTESPGYQFRLSEGQNQLENYLASRGMSNSGVAGRSLQEYGQNYATNEYDNFLNRYYQSLNPWLSIAGKGQVAAGQTAQMGQNTALNVGQNQLAAGNARASGYINQANALTGGIQSGMNNYLMYQGLQNQRNSSLNYSAQNTPITSNGSTLLM